MPRITVELLEKTTLEVIEALADGNKAAGHAMAKMSAFTEAKRKLGLDDQVAIGPLLDLDDEGIYGEDIARLFGLCDLNIGVMMTALHNRAFKGTPLRKALDIQKETMSKEEGQKAQETRSKRTRRRCDVCGLRIRGENHDDHCKPRVGKKK